MFEDKNAFKGMLKANTQDYQMVVIDQTEAKFNANEVFFKDLADDNPEPYKIGDDTFWEESGCDWQEQLEKYDNLEKGLKSKEKEDWKKIAEERRKKSEAREQQKQDEKRQWETNQLELAPKELREMYHNELRKRMGLDKGSHLSRAKHATSELFRFIPTKFSFDKRYP